MEKVHPSIASAFFFWAVPLPFTSSFMLSLLCLLWGFPSLCSCPLSSGWSLSISLCSCIYKFSLWPMNLTAAGGRLTFPCPWLLGEGSQGILLAGEAVVGDSCVGGNASCQRGDRSPCLHQRVQWLRGWEGLVGVRSLQGKCPFKTKHTKFVGS